MKDDRQVDIERARAAAAASDVALKRTAHRYFAECGPELKEPLAEALDTSVGTLSRQCQVHDLPMQVRMISAARVLLPDLAAQLLDDLADAWQLRWRERAPLTANTEDLRRMIAHALEAAAGAATQALADAADGRITMDELAETEPLLERAIRQLSELQASMRRAAISQAASR